MNQSLITIAYIAASALFILSLGGLSQQETARRGNLYGILGMLIAFALGALHALSPGHGKTVVASFLVGSRGTARQALFLGAVVTFTHTIGVFLLGLAVLFLSDYVVPERLYPWIGFLSGAMILGVGVNLFRQRFSKFAKLVS